MMKKQFLAAILVISFISIQAQVDQKAKSILDKLSAKTKTYKSIEAKFSYTLENKVDNIKETQTGTLITQGSKYNLVIGGQHLMCDGKTIWTYLPDAEEVTITDVPTEGDDEDYISPTTIFTLYEKGFKYKYIKEGVVKGKTIQTIHLFPTDPDEKSYHTLKLFIDKTKQQIAGMKILSKDGTTYTYDIISFVANATIPASKFTFNKAKYPDVEINDMRD